MVVQTSVYSIVRQAIVNKQIVVANYRGKRRWMCPHVIGTKDGNEQALFYQFDGDSSGELEPDGSPGNWRCVQIALLSDVEAEDGKWHSASNYSRAQTCVDRIDVKVPI